MRDTLENIPFAMDYKKIEKRLLAANVILSGDSLDRTAFASLKTLLSGIHPKIDTSLSAADKAFFHIDSIQKGDVISLTVDAIPAHTPEEKKRKKLILLFLKYWRDLGSEVARVEKEMSEAKQHGDSGSAMAKLMATAKGPLGVITLIAAGIVTLKASEVSVRIRNINCQPITPTTKFAVKLPGLSLPQEVIEPGGEATAKLAPVSISVDATNPDEVLLSLYGARYTFTLGSRDIRFIFDGETLNGRATTVDLRRQKLHTLELRCA